MTYPELKKYLSKHPKLKNQLTFFGRLDSQMQRQILIFYNKHVEYKQRLNNDSIHESSISLFSFNYMTTLSNFEITRFVILSQPMLSYKEICSMNRGIQKVLIRTLKSHNISSAKFLNYNKKGFRSRSSFFRDLFEKS